MINLADLEGLALAGKLTAADIVQAHNAIDRLSEQNAAVLAQRRRKESWRRGVINYAMAVAPRFGLECSLPKGDRG